MKKTSKKEWEIIARQYSTPHIRKAYIRKPAFVNALGNIKGKKIIDLGCGDGYYSRILARGGANVTGVDFSRQSILLAQELEKKQPLGIRYYCLDLAEMSKIKNGQFDFAIADMVFVTVSTQRKYEKIAKEVKRVLKPHGEILMSKGHPGNFFKQGVSKHYKLTYKKEQSYFDSLAPQKVQMNIAGKWVVWTNYHRTLEDFISPWLKNKFCITNIIEPKPSLAAVKRFPEHLGDSLKIPHFIIFRMKKQA